MCKGSKHVPASFEILEAEIIRSLGIGREVDDLSVEFKLAGVSEVLSWDVGRWCTAGWRHPRHLGHSSHEVYRPICMYIRAGSMSGGG